MFIRASTVLFSAVALAGLATAAPGGGSSQCNTGSPRCCGNYQNSESPMILELFELLGLPPPSPSSLVGIDCNIDIDSCHGSPPVCCDGDNMNGAIATGCKPTISA